MRAIDVIEKKRNGHKLSSEEIRFLVQGYMNKDIPDYQMSAWLMAVYFQGMDAEETAALTLEMARTGYELNLQEISGIKVDKHSTGGVGDTTTLILAPLVASAGIPIAKMSGRGLGHTGGTIDKLESIRGFQVERTKQQFIEQVNAIGVAVMSQTANIAPADKQLYALRDVTATVDSIPLIASSIMSKKIASGADAIVLDVKTGPGAFMKTEAEAMELAKMMVDIGRNVGRKTVAVISSMQQPLGYAIGNALEVKEAIDTLRGEGPDDLIELCLELGAHMLAVSGVSEMREGKNKLHQCIQSGQALQKLKEWITFQGGDAAVIDQPELLPKASHVEQVTAIKGGYVQGIKSEQLGKAAMRLGAGRQTKDSEIDLAAGIMLHKKIGDSVEPGEVLAELHWNEKRADTAEITKMVSEAYQVDAVPVNAPPLVLAVVNSVGIISKQ